MIEQFHSLIIHSDLQTNNQIKEYLEEKEMICHQITKYNELKDIHDTYDCIIIENDFPRINLKNTIVHFKIQSNPIIIVLSNSMSSHYLDSLLNAGADDYQPVPFKCYDLYSKIMSIYKNGILKPREIYRFKDLILNKTAKTCTCNEQSINLTKNEFKLLSILISHPYQPFSINYLFEKVWGSSIYEDGTSIPALINSLIIKLRIANEQTEYIKRFGKNSYKMAF